MWLVAWDRYALAALAVEHQLDFSLSLLHKEVVLAIATAAAAGGRSELLGVLYDELARCCFVLPLWCVPPPLHFLLVSRARKKWDHLSGKLGEAFDIGSASARNEVGGGYCGCVPCRRLLLCSGDA